MTDLDISIAEAPESDWALWRDLRLDALRNAPSAFGETLAGALERDEANWRSWWHGETALPRFIARIDGEPRGMVSIVLPADHDYHPLVVSMWVSPRARGRGLGRALLDTCVDWCARTGRDRLRLGVVEGNAAAERLYVTYGFEFTGATVPLLSDASRLLKWMQIPVAAPDQHQHQHQDQDQRLQHQDQDQRLQHQDQDQDQRLQHQHQQLQHQQPEPDLAPQEQEPAPTA